MNQINSCGNRNDFVYGSLLFTNCGLAPGLVRAGGLASQQTRHLGGQNYAFADGHAKWYKGVEGVTATNQIATTKVYNGLTPFSNPNAVPAGVTANGTVSGQNPTFNVTFDLRGLLRYPNGLSVVMGNRLVETDSQLSIFASASRRSGSTHPF